MKNKYSEDLSSSICSRDYVNHCLKYPLASCLLPYFIPLWVHGKMYLRSFQAYPVSLTITQNYSYFIPLSDANIFGKSKLHTDNSIPFRPLLEYQNKINQYLYSIKQNYFL